MFDNVLQCCSPFSFTLKESIRVFDNPQFNKLIPCDKTVTNGIREYASMRCILVLINIIKHRQISLTCLLPTHPRPSQPRYDTDDTDLRDSVWKKRTWHQNIWRYLTLLSVGIFYWWLPLSKYWTSINILEMWVEAGGWRHRVYCTGDTYTEYDNMTIWQYNKLPRQYVWTLKCS